MHYPRPSSAAAAAAAASSSILPEAWIKFPNANSYVQKLGINLHTERANALLPHPPPILSAIYFVSSTDDLDGDEPSLEEEASAIHDSTRRLKLSVPIERQLAVKTKCFFLVTEQSSASISDAARSIAVPSAKPEPLSFEQLLKRGRISPKNGIVIKAMRRLPQFFANALATQNIEAAVQVYLDAQELPSADTVHNLESQGYKTRGELYEGLPKLFTGMKMRTCVPVVFKSLRSDEAVRIATFLKHMKGKDEDEEIVDLCSHLLPTKILKAGKHTLAVSPHYPSTLEQYPSLDDESAQTLWQHMSEVLEWLHARSYAHADIKPANIFVATDGQFILGDLGSVAPFMSRTHSTEVFVPSDIVHISSSALDYAMLAMTIADKTCRIPTIADKTGSSVQTWAMKEILEKLQTGPLSTQQLEFLKDKVNG